MNLGAGISNIACIGASHRIFNPETRRVDARSGCRARLLLLMLLRRVLVAPVRLRVDALAPLSAALAPGTPHHALLPAQLGDQGAAPAAGHALLRLGLLGLLRAIGLLPRQGSQQISGRASVWRKMPMTDTLKSLNILVVDDEAPLRETLTRSFSREGHHVQSVANGQEAIERAGREHYDIVLLDVALGPGPNGYEVCRTLRERRNVVPIIMLTALDSEADAVQGLEAGADDYVTKPFGLAELRSRVRAVLRRASGRAAGRELVSIGDVTLDHGRREVTVRGEAVRLTFSEFELLSRLMSEPGHLFNRQELLRAIWGDSAYRDPRAIDVHIRHLREKLELKPEDPKLILTVRGAGYRFQAP
jgi:DNA-binding response OmpR family regulator